ncbi:MAG TPA: type II toxin-antitoxin system RelE/ParE family toxin [Spirochaetota bacterium]|nr:type II toxin-antitoxin system RelE/ParE family toxin [Spirochaetota bacterium]HQH31793.1 type II toxin-antitoxin system RelE/ParE family toxin [Spirochaetota bacterium]HQJ06614.1 type II toxin-antitoxin system RelE/ParE family toxin [Spirochaetota bacterium]
MNNYSIKFTGLANRDLEDIFSYISNELDSRNVAIKLLNKIESKIDSLKDFPYSCPTVTNSLLQNYEYRKLIVDNYIIFYIIDEEKKNIIIMRCLYGARNLNELL